MASRDEIESATIPPPRRGQTDQIAGTAATQVFAARATWLGKKVRFEAIGDDFWILTGPDATLTITPAAVLTLGAPGAALPAGNVNIAEKVANGAYKEFDFTSEDAFVAVRATGTGGLLMFRATETALGAS
jgi:hypothetical protein